MNGLPSTYVFGYGSLVNRASVAKTIPRPAEELLLRPALLQGYIRQWNMVVPVLDAEKREREAVFLNIAPANDVQCWGTLVAVHDAELPLLDARERGYDRVDVTHLITPKPDLPVVTYIGRPEHTRLTERSVILQKYLTIIDDGLQEWGDEARRLFALSTHPHSLPVYSGSYSFPHLDG